MKRKTKKKKPSRFKKLKAYFEKKMNSFKEYVSAQKFYFNHFLRASSKLTLSALKISMLVIAMLISGLAANKVHMKWLEQSVGSNVVYIQSLPDAAIQGSGTAFEVKTPHGKVVTLTNAHICQLANDKGLVGILEKKHSKRIIPVRVIEVYPENDLCILEGLAGYEGLELGSETEVGEPVWALGYPLGEALNISDGRVKDFSPILLVDRKPLEECNGPKNKILEQQFFFFLIKVCTREFDSVQTSMVIFPGNSGSPMVNIFGKVVGVVFASNNRTNWGSAVPFKDVQKALSAY